MNEIGCFGKVPAHGDFVWQALPARFVTPWDTWLQEQLVDLRESLGDNWLETYLCGPIWRFLLQDEALGAGTWCGIITPSVDVVGRYFPFTIATTLPQFTSIAHAPAELDAWYRSAEQTALDALTETLSVEDVLSRVREHPTPELTEYGQEPHGVEQGTWSGYVNAGDTWSASLLHKLVYETFDSPCLWSRVDPESDAMTYQLTNGYQGFTSLFRE